MEGGARAVIAQTLRYAAAKIDGIKIDPYSLRNPQVASNIIANREISSDQLDVLLKFLHADESVRIVDQGPIREIEVAILIHAYYTELLPELLEACKNVRCRKTFFISTDSEKKIEEIRALMEGQSAKFEVRKFENRGRDIYPKLFGFIDVYDRYQYVLHLHTKRSDHGGELLSSWRKYILKRLIGSATIADRNITFLLNGSGVVYPETYPVLRRTIGWGLTRATAEKLAASAGITLPLHEKIDFPSGSMFFACSAALRPILNLKLSQQDFEVESGQLDGTTAHAIERLILLSAQAANLHYICVPDLVEGLRELVSNEPSNSPV